MQNTNRCAPSRRHLLQASLLPAGTMMQALVPPAIARAAASTPTVAVQVAPFNFFDEGIEQALDRIVGLAQANAVFVYSHTYYGIPYNRTADVLADDHGHEPGDDETRVFNPVWVKHNRRTFRHTRLWFAEPDPGCQYAERDIFSELERPAQRRGVRVFARLLEPGRLDVKGRIHHFDEVTSLDVFGAPANEPCRNNPQYRAWAVAMVQDLFDRYDLDGYQWGSERSGPLSEALWRGRSPGCFCKHCERRAKRDGVDPVRARKGYRALLALTTRESTMKDTPTGADTRLNQVAALFLEYPEILAWEHQWRIALEEVAELIHAAVKVKKPQAQVGRHLASNATTLDPVSRAGNDYIRMTRSCDFLKPILYQDVTGARLKDQVQSWISGLFRGVSGNGLLELVRSFNGYAPGTLPPLSQLDRQSLPPSYVFDETRRLKALMGQGGAVFAGIGVNVPHRQGKSFRRTPFDADTIAQSVVKAFEAGATGVVASREYDEMRLPALRAFGHGVSLAAKA